MYSGFLHLHNLLRWLILFAGLFSVIRACIGWSGKKKWTKTDKISGTIFTSLLDLQILAGLVLYAFLSPFTRNAFSDFGAAMKNAGLRFYAVEHILIMFAAIVVIHIGGIKAKKAMTDESKHRLTAIYYTAGILLIVAAIPWERALLF